MATDKLTISYDPLVTDGKPHIVDLADAAGDGMMFRFETPAEASAFVLNWLTVLAAGKAESN